MCPRAHRNARGRSRHGIDVQRVVSRDELAVGALEGEDRSLHDRASSKSLIDQGSPSRRVGTRRGGHHCQPLLILSPPCTLFTSQPSGAELLCTISGDAPNARPWTRLVLGTA